MVTRRTLLLLAAFLLAGTLAFPSTAAPLFGGPADSLDDGVELAPSSDYAYLEDDELVVDVSPSNPAIEGEGLNPDGRTTLGGVFRIQYTGSTYAEVWLSHDAEGITFSVGGRPIDSRAGNVTLAPNESVPVSMTVNTTADADGYVGDITVHARVASPETETETEAAPSADTVRSVVVENGSRRFTALASRDGGTLQFDASSFELDSAESATLTLDSVSVGTSGGPLTLETDAVDPETAAAVVQAGVDPLGGVNVTVESGSVRNATLRFSVSKAYLEARDVDPAALTVVRASDGEVSELQVRTTGERNGRVTFVAETPGFSTFVVAVERPELTVTDVRLDRETAAPGAPVTVRTTVSNDGAVAGERRITVTVDGEPVAERTVDVAAGTTETVAVNVTDNATGEHVVGVAGTDRGTFVVASPTNDTETTATAATAGATPTGTAAAVPPIEEPGGFGLSQLAGLVGMLVIAATLLALGRRVPWP